MKEDKLFRLVSSLSANEKGFFKKHFQRDASKENILMLKLFNIYNNYNIYDEDAINKNIKKAGFYSQESKLKSVLYQALLDTLKQYSKKDTPLEKISTLLDDITVLENKFLFSDAKSRLYKAKKIAKEYELYDRWLLVIKKERTLYPTFDSNPATIAALLRDNQLEYNTVERYKKDETIILQLNYQILTHLTKTGIVALSEIQKKAKQIFEEANIDESTLTKRNEIFHLSTKTYMAIIEQNNEKFEELESLLQQKIIDENHEKCMSVTLKTSMIFNLLHGVQRAKNCAYVDNVIHCCKTLYPSIATSAKNERKTVSNMLNILELVKDIISRKYDKGIAHYLKKLKEEKIDANHPINDNLISIYYNLGYLYMYANNYKDVIKSLNQIYLKTNNDSGAIRESEIIFMMLLANIKLNQSDTVEILAKDYITVYQRNDLQLPNRKKIVNNIHKNPFLNQQKILQEIKQTIASSHELDFSYGFNLLDLKLWLENN
jgi:hypothetical protein